MQEESLLAACICLTVVLLLNAASGPLIEERRTVTVPATWTGEKVSVSHNTHVFEAGIKNERVIDWRPKAICTPAEATLSKSITGLRKCLNIRSEKIYREDLSKALARRSGFYVVFANWRDSPIWISVILYMLAFLPLFASLLAVCESLSIQIRSCAINTLRASIYFSLFQPLQLAVFIGPAGILANYYGSRIPAMIFVVPSALGVSLEQAAWFIPAAQVAMSSYALIAVNKYARTFIPTLSFRDFLARDMLLSADPRSVEDEDVYWEQFLSDALQEARGREAGVTVRDDGERDADAFPRLPRLGRFF